MDPGELKGWDFYLTEQLVDTVAFPVEKGLQVIVLLPGVLSSRFSQTRFDLLPGLSAQVGFFCGCLCSDVRNMICQPLPAYGHKQLAILVACKNLPAEWWSIVMPDDIGACGLAEAGNERHAGQQKPAADLGKGGACPAESRSRQAMAWKRTHGATSPH